MPPPDGAARLDILSRRLAVPGGAPPSSLNLADLADLTANFSAAALIQLCRRIAVLEKSAASDQVTSQVAKLVSDIRLSHVTPAADENEACARYFVERQRRYGN